MTRNTRLALALALTAAGAYAVSRLRSSDTPATPGSAGATTSPSAPVGTSGAGPSAPAPSSERGKGTAAAAQKGDEFAPLFAERLATFAKKSGVEASARGGEVRLGRGLVTIDTRLEHDGPTETRLGEKDKDKLGIGIAVGAAVDEEPAGTFYFIGPAIGVGRSRSEALEVAVGGWLGLSGSALVEAVAHRADSASAVRMGRLVAYPGTLAVRGTVELGWSHKRDEELLRAMAPVIGGLRPDLSHSIALTIMVIGGGAIDGQCLLDNAASEELCKLVLKFAFPGSSDGYLVRQVYLLRPAVTK